jgi:hypothetical protein
MNTDHENHKVYINTYSKMFLKIIGDLYVLYDQKQAQEVDYRHLRYSTETLQNVQELSSKLKIDTLPQYINLLKRSIIKYIGRFSNTNIMSVSAQAPSCGKSRGRGRGRGRGTIIHEQTSNINNIQNQKKEKGLFEYNLSFGTFLKQMLINFDKYSMFNVGYGYIKIFNGCNTAPPFDKIQMKCFGLNNERLQYFKSFSTVAVCTKCYTPINKNDIKVFKRVNIYVDNLLSHEQYSCDNFHNETVLLPLFNYSLDGKWWWYNMVEWNNNLFSKYRLVLDTTDRFSITWHIYQIKLNTNTITNTNSGKRRQSTKTTTAATNVGGGNTQNESLYTNHSKMKQKQKKKNSIVGDTVHPYVYPTPTGDLDITHVETFIFNTIHNTQQIQTTNVGCLKLLNTTTDIMKYACDGCKLTFYMKC